MAIGAYNDSLWLLGGSGGIAWTEMLHINTFHDTVTQYNNSFVCAGQFFQRGTVLFCTQDTNDNIIGFDLRSRNITYDIAKNETTDDNGLCIAGSGDYLFMTAYTYFHIYDLGTNHWTIGPVMPQRRVAHACNVVNDVLYLIGGHSSNPPFVLLDSVSFIDISDPFSNPSWSVFPESLSVARDYIASVVYNEYIYAVGGRNLSKLSVDVVERIDTIHANISVDSPMLYAKHMHAVIIMNCLLFSFGGEPTDTNTHYQYAVLPSCLRGSLSWHESDNEITEMTGKSGMAVGFHNHSVWFLGGSRKGGAGKEELFEYDLLSEAVTSHSNAITYNGESELYYQIGSVLFVSYWKAGYNIIAFDLKSQTVVHNITKWTDATTAGLCMTATHDSLFITGGAGPLVNTFRIYNMSTAQWAQGEAMPYPRRGHSCDIVHQSMYVISGATVDSAKTKAVIVIDIGDPYHASWSVFPDTLHLARISARSVVYDECIYVIGGQVTSLNQETNLVERIDTYNEIVFLDSSMLYAKYAIGLVAIENVLFAFQGLPGSNYTHYQYAVITTPAPTTHPTSAPTHSPSIAPSSSPSNPPTVAPSISPSLAPTNAPSLAPSSTPSQPPSIAPSLAPSQAPTACVDYYNYNSLDGIDIINTIRPSRSHPVLYEEQMFPSNANAHVQKYISTDTAFYFFDADVECDRDGADINICFIGCYDVGHCALANIYSAAKVELDEIRLICGARKACAFARVNVTDAKVDALTILCNDAMSCEGMEITINAISDIDISIDCTQFFSCVHMMVRLERAHARNYNNEIHVDITCYDDHSCAEMIVDTDDSPNIFIHLNVERYSDEIQIIHHYWQNVAIQCGVDEDRRYIRYDTHSLLDEYEILKLARDEHDAQKLPCEDIRIICSNNTDFERECRYKYTLRNFSLVHVLKDENRPNCYWLEIGQLYNAECVGTCGDKAVYPQYNKTVHLDLIFNDDEYDDSSYDDATLSRNRTTISYKICDEYFGSVNVTDDSLSSIDAVFYSVLKVMSASESAVLHGIISPPDTVLRDNLTAVECKTEEINTIRITTSLGVESIHSKKSVDGLFREGNTFITESTALLSKLFGIPISIQHIDTVTSQDAPKEVVVTIALCALFIIGCILCAVMRSHKKRKAAIEALTTYISNPMVIFLGIGVYEESPSDPQVNGHFQSLSGIDCDSVNVKTLFGERLKYNVFPAHLQLQWTSKQIKQFLTQKADELESNIDRYDGLVVILSCHGIPDYIISSDYKKIKKTAIHRLFTSQKPKLRQIPRLFLFDCCDGDETRGHATRGDAIEVIAGQEESDAQSDKMYSELKGAKTQAMTRTISKKVSLSSIASSDGSWLRNEENPDFQLVTIHAANEGFQSKLHIRKGSYVISAFTQKMTENLENGNTKWLFQICDDIQSELHSQGKQHTVNTFNDNMRYLKFVRNGSKLGGNLLHNSTVSDKLGGNLLHNSTVSTEAKGGKFARFRSDKRQASLQNEMKQFFGNIGLEQYCEEFESNGYTTTHSLRVIDDDVLSGKLHIKSSAHREIILDAIAEIAPKNKNAEIVYSDSNDEMDDNIDVGVVECTTITK